MSEHTKLGLAFAITAFATASLTTGALVAHALPTAAPQHSTSAAPTAQDDERERPALPESLPGASDLQQEMIRLFGEVESHLEEVDTLLYEASGADPFGDGEGLREWIDGARDNGRSAVEKIDELLEIADQMQQQNEQQQQNQSQSQQNSGQNRQQGQQDQQQSSSRQQGGQENQQQSSRDQRDQTGRSSRERTPEGPNEAGAQNQQQSSGSEPQGQAGARPEDGGESDADGENQRGEAQDDASRTANDDPRAFGRWGELPPRTQEIFTNTASDDMPPQYRDWIDAYYRRVSRSN